MTDASRADTLEAQAEERLQRSDREWIVAMAVVVAVLLVLGWLAFRSLDRSAAATSKNLDVFSCTNGTALIALDALAHDVIPPAQFRANPDLRHAFDKLGNVVDQLDVEASCRSAFVDDG